MKTVLEFLAQRKVGSNEFFPSPGSRKTVLISSHDRQTELMAYALWLLGCNVLVAEPWSEFFGEDQRFVRLDNVFTRWVQMLRKFKVQLVIGANETAMVPHPQTKELLHRAAGVPAVNFWSADPRTMPPMTRRGYTASDYVTCLRDPRTVNVFWDVDVMEEVQQFLGVANVAHVPLGTTPELWETSPAPLKDRPVPLCYVADDDPQAGAFDGQWPDAAGWAERVARLKLAELDRPMVSCIEQVGGPGESRGSTARRPYELAPTLKEEFGRWQALNGTLLNDGRNAILRAAAERVGDAFQVYGSGWERLRIRARSREGRADEPQLIYARSRASLHPLGESIHGGVSSAAYEIACSGGLLLSQYTRELSQLFEPGRECVAFRNADEFRAACERIEAHPSEFDSVVENGRLRAMAEHTWEHRMARVLELAKERFDLPW